MTIWKVAVLALAISYVVVADAYSQTPGTSTGITHVAGPELAWEPVEQPAFPEGLEVRRLHRNPRIDGGSSVLRFPAGYAEPRHFHTTAGHSIYVLRGRINYTGIEAAEGHFFYTPPNVVHDLVALEESEILIWSDGPLDLHLSEASVEK